MLLGRVPQCASRRRSLHTEIECAGKVVGCRRGPKADTTFLSWTKHTKSFQLKLARSQLYAQERWGSLEKLWQALEKKREPKDFLDGALVMKAFQEALIRGVVIFEILVSVVDY